jgi:hypothetical protein
VRQWRKTWLAVRDEVLWIEVFDADHKLVVRMETSPVQDYADLAFKHALKIGRKVGGEVRIRGVGGIVLAKIPCLVEKEEQQSADL